METTGGWSLIEPDSEPPKQAAEPAGSGDHVSRALVAGIVVAVAGIVLAAIWLTLPSGGVTVDSPGNGLVPRAVGAVGTSALSSFAIGTPAPMPATLIVDVEGAVVSPGVHALPDGSRVGDAIAAAGGYAATVDIAVASRSLNLAARLTDGQQVHVPALGETAAPASAPDAGGGGGASAAPAGGLVDINHATAEELDTLPGIGPVTAQKIIDARTQAPFASVDELQSRGVVGASTFEKLRDLITVTP
ncbi:MAG TPA: ComEA family DNA-binding protein [Candidatus Limnocylindrales bacterium]